MTSPTNWPHPDRDPELYLRHQEKRILNEQRRPMVRKASDILGPGFGPFATQILDWSADETAFNGYFWSAGDASNAPLNIGSSGAWLGWTLSTGAMGLEKVWNMATMAEYERTWVLASGVRIYSAWSGVWIAVSFVNAWADYGSGYQPAAYRIRGDTVELRGLITGGAMGAAAFTLPTGFLPPGSVEFDGANLSGGYVYIDTAGVVTPGGAGTYAALDGRSFSVTA